MGELTDDMIEGRSCSLCGQYFCDPKDQETIYEHGHPVVCKDCWAGLTKEERKMYEKAEVPTF